MKFQERISVLFKLFQIIQKSETLLNLVSETSITLIPECCLSNITIDQSPLGTNVIVEKNIHKLNPKECGHGKVGFIQRIQNNLLM